MLVYGGVDGCNPYCSIVRHDTAYIVHGLLAGYYAGYMDMFRIAFGQQRFVCQFHGATCGQHGIGYDEDFVCDVRRCYVFDVDVEIQAVLILPIGGYKGIFTIVEIVEEAVMERQSCSKDRSEHYFVLGYGALGLTQGRSDGTHLLGHLLADLIGHYFSHTFYIATKAQSIVLNSDIAHLHDESIEKRMLST